MTSDQRAKYSKILIWLGFLAWLPYIVFRAFRIDIVILPFLAVHLVGVIGGSFLSRDPNQPAKPISSQEKFRKTFSTVLILLGVSMWGLYFGLELITGVEREVTPFLIAHLSGVLSGAGIKIYNFLSRK